MYMYVYQNRRGTKIIRETHIYIVGMHALNKY